MTLLKRTHMFFHLKTTRTVRTYQKDQDGNFVEQNINDFSVGKDGRLQKTVHNLGDDYEVLDEPLTYYTEDGKEYKVYHQKKTINWVLEIFFYLFMLFIFTPLLYGVWGIYHQEIYIFGRHDSTLVFGDRAKNVGYAYIWGNISLMLVPYMFSHLRQKLMKFNISSIVDSILHFISIIIGAIIILGPTLYLMFYIK